MAFLIFAVIMIVIIATAVSSNKKTTAGVNEYDRLVGSGVPARGILLRVSAARSALVSRGLQSIEQRWVFVDVEIPGTAPYEVSASPWLPLSLSRDVLPGATVELRVDQMDKTKMVIVGPGVGFAATNLLGGASGQGGGYS